MTTTPVLIVGGGPVGLTASILLSRHGVSSVLVERKPDVNDHPRARSISRRTMEIYRGLGLFESMVQVSLPAEWTREVIYTTTLCGPEIGRVRTLGFASVVEPEVSPAMPLMSSQDRIEPVLRRAAAAYELAQVRFGCEVKTLVQDAQGVRATVIDKASGAEERLVARYVIAADGAGSPVRDDLGIELEGQLALMTVADVHFKADLHRYVDHRPAPLIWVDPKGSGGVFQPLDTHESWRCQIVPDSTLGTAADLTPALCTEWIRSAVGDADREAVKPQILSVRPWTMHAATAGRFRTDRIFLAGDAAHILPPTGGLGMNCGIQGIHNLAWKLAAVLRGFAGPALLSTYETERKPVAHENAQASLTNSRAVGAINQAYRQGGDVAAALAQAEQYGNFAGLDLGFAYPEGAVLPDGSPPPEVDDAIQFYRPTARPGHRAPHVDLERQGSALSTLDLFGPHFTLLAAERGGVWIEAAEELAGRRRVPLQAHRIAPDAELRDPGGEWRAVYELSSEGAVLVRPDGVVAWRQRAAPADAPAELDRALGRALAL